MTSHSPPEPDYPPLQPVNWQMLQQARQTDRAVSDGQTIKTRAMIAIVGVGVFGKSFAIIGSVAFGWGIPAWLP